MIQLPEHSPLMILAKVTMLFLTILALIYIDPADSLSHVLIIFACLKDGRFIPKDLARDISYRILTKPFTDNLYFTIGIITNKFVK